MTVWPAGMMKRLPSFLAWAAGLGFAGLGDANGLVTIPAGAWLGALLALLLFVLWGERTRPKPNGFWFLVGIVWTAGMLVPYQPFHAVVAGTAVALLWLHDAPGAPSAMLGWGLFVLVWQGDPNVWTGTGEDEAFYVAMGMTMVVFGAQLERERLARRRYARIGYGWNTVRIVVVALVTLVMLAGRESLRAASLFAALGLDVSGVGGRVAMIAVLLVSLAVAAALFRVRPARVRVKAPRVSFDAGPRPTAVRDALERKAEATGKAAAPAAPARKRPAANGPLAPGEIDFD